MELSKDQIKYIDQLLEEKGVKFWDVRLEMTDHIVNKIENDLTDKNEFKSAVDEGMNQLGYHGNIKQLMTSKQLEIQKRFRKIHWKELISFFTNWKTLIPFLTLTLIALYQLNNRFNLIVMIIFFFIPPIIVYLYSLFQYNKVFKSVFILSSTIAESITISVLSLLIILPKIIFGDDYKTPNWYLICYIILSIPLLYSSTKVFVDAFRKYNYPLIKK